MLRTYGKQITTAKRLARYQRTLKAAGMQDQVTISREAKRSELVQKVAHEVMENLLVEGSENTVVRGILARLESEIGEKLVFDYPPMEQELLIYRVRGEQAHELAPGERAAVVERLWRITLETVDDTML
ncbi:MAG: hypothetical protein HQK81_11165 [Desulfovibrionaceae bacterium]|nr:hypothetical protein [Desulfovibrionaceae bacterium]MBF0514602.1 hypothetical protein [Desulfovibrionaceae bacterium]